MAWPDPSEYDAAVQSPQQNFDDPELRAGTVRTNTMGLPKPISGGFATVYQVECGPRVWAVRCFQREIPDQQQRYTAISKHLATAHLPYAVGFTYLPRGVRVRGQWYPILKMEWVKGESLNAYIEKNLQNPATLQQLANQFLSMVTTLQQANIAHGDLQHGNILVATGNLKLIDYDGMYVPALAGWQSNENGEPNYQHPQRNGTHFGLYLDNFSVWVIYLSIVALSIDPNLWKVAGAGKENLLFHRVDFEKPHASTILTLLTMHADPRLQGLASLFASALYVDPSDVPPIQAAPIPTPTLPTVASSGIPDWLKDQIQSSPLSASATDARPATPPPVHNIDWLLDFVSPLQAPKRFTSPIMVPRLSLSGVIAVVFCVLVFHIPLIIGSGLIGAVGVVVTLITLFFYGSDPVFAEKKPLLLELRQNTSALAEVQRTLTDADSRKANLHTEHNKTLQALVVEKAALQRKEQQELGQVQTELANEFRSIDTQISDLEKPIHRLRADASDRKTQRQQQLAQLNQAESNEMANALRPIQQQFVPDFMHRHRIGSGSVPGIGPTMVARLAARGYVTAADINWGVSNVSGIGDAKAANLMGWRNVIEQRALASMPQNLTQAQINGIHAKYQSQRMQLQQEIDSIATSAQQMETTLVAQNMVRFQQLRGSRTAAQQRSQQQAQAIVQRYQQVYTAFSEKEVQDKAQLSSELKNGEGEEAQARKLVFEANWQLAKTRRALEPYNRISLAGYIQQTLGIQRRGKQG